MGVALDWYRREFCLKEGHTHGDAGEMSCILLKMAELAAKRK